MTSKFCPFCDKEMKESMKKDVPTLKCDDCDESFIDEGRMPKKVTKKFHPGGLMRCCLKTLEDSEVKEKIGEILKCKYCDDSMIFDGKLWRWHDQRRW